jgi:hypothetical protein
MFEHVNSGREQSIELTKGWAAVDPVEATRSRRRRTGDERVHRALRSIGSSSPPGEVTGAAPVVVAA